MPIGINNVTSVYYQNITDLMNVSGYADFAVKVNHDIYSGLFWFFMFWLIGIVLYFKFQDSKDQPLINIMFASAAMTILSLFARAVEVVQNGVVRGMLTDKQMWVFPIISILLAGIIWMMKER